MDRKKINAIVAYVSRSLSAAALMIWGVVNITGFVFEYNKQTGDDGNWIPSAIMCGVFGLLPFFIGSRLLYRNIASVSKSSAAE